MKNNILYLFLISILLSCSATPKKPEQRKKFLKGFSTYYNTMFNAKDALNTEFENRDKNHKDNFYAPYISILTIEEQPLGSNLGQSTSFAENSMKMSEVSKNSAPRNPNSGPPGMPTNSFGNSVGTQIGGGNIPSATGTPAVKGATILEIAEAKAMKAVKEYSVIRKGAEQNKEIFNAYIIMAQSRIYQGKPVAALEAVNSIFVKMKDDKRLPLAKIYQAVAYSKMKDYDKSNDIFAQLRQEKLDKDYDKLLGIYYAETLLDQDKKDEALKQLNLAFDSNSNRKLKSRIAYVRGQVLQNLNKNDLARESFKEAYKYANNFEFEVKSQVEIAKTFNGTGDYQGAKKYLEDISKKGTYASRKNEFYYALGLMANKANKKDEAQDFFRKSLTEKVSDEQIRGLTFYEIGKYYLDKNDYIGAGAYYDSALVAMTYEPSKVLLKGQSESIKKIAKNYYLIRKNDSILALAKMSEPDKKAFFGNIIEKLKVKEAKEEAERRKAERLAGFDTGDYNANSVFGSSGNGFQDFGVASKGFYFSNTGTVSKGNSNFKQTWGNRGLSDNWRYSQTMPTLQDTKNAALGITSTPNPRRFEVDYYIEKIPKDQGTLSQLKKDRDTASLGLGTMYQNYFENTALATKTLYDLVDQKPEEKVEIQALYEIFAMNYQNNPSAAERAKQKMLADYPYTSYAEFVRNPKSNTFVKASPEVETGYMQAFDLYEAEKFAESKALLEQLIAQNPKDAFIPKLNLLNAFNTGKLSGKEVMILQLEQIALNYEKTPEGQKAKEMLNYMKSDLSFNATDNKGNSIQNNPPGAPPTMPPANDNGGVPPNAPNVNQPTGNVPPQNVNPQQTPMNPNNNKGLKNKVQQKPAQDIQLKQ